MPNAKLSGWFAVFVAVIFTAGVATGLILRGYFEQRSAASVRTEAPSPSFANLTRRLSSELDLNAAQTEQLRKILLSRRERLMELHKDLRARVDGELTEVSAEIDRILTPDQRERFQQFVFKMRMRLETPGK